MRASGVICEFNPFHAGHAYLLSRMRELAGEQGCVVALMSGRFVQRGEAAMADPYLRGEMALCGGADLVLELPFPWSAASADYFAAAGVSVLSRLGMASIAFGSESGDIERLRAAAHTTDSEAFLAVYAALCRQGMGTTAAYAKAIREVGGEGMYAEDFPGSNDLLGMAYLRALKRRSAAGLHTPEVQVIQRQGAAYREDVLAAEGFPSATALRAVICEAASDPRALRAILDGTMPTRAMEALLAAVTAGEAPLDSAPLMQYYHTYYRLQTAEDLECFAELSGGIASHIIRVAQDSANVRDFAKSLHTKQFTDARLRRAMLFGALKVVREDLMAEPAYVTLLGATERGCRWLRAYRRRVAVTDELPLTIVTKPADAPDCAQRRLGERADGLFTLCFPAPRVAGAMLRCSPVLADRER